MNKILMTIDFDIIMSPSIIFYNNLVPQMKWEDILTYPSAASFQPDYALYLILTNYLCEISKKITANQIKFITKHDQVCDFIDPNTKYNIINIDHHHDLGYGKNAESGYPLNCANWVKILIDNEQCNSYLWIHNETSEIHDYAMQQCTDMILRNAELDKLSIPDELYIIVSPEWVPPECLYLLDCWMIMLQTLYGQEFELY